MPSLSILLKWLGLITGALIALAAITLGLLIYFAKPAPPLAARLAALPPAERATLDAVLEATELKLADLRDVGSAASPDHPENRRAISIERGHVFLLSLQGIGPKALPSLSAWTALEQLSLKGNGLTSLPELSGCGQLHEFDASDNALERLEAASFPVNLRTVELSGNPLSDLAPLAHLNRAERITVRRAKVADFSPLLDLPLPLLDLRENPVTTLPERFPKSGAFRVDLEGCPVFTPPGYLREWSFRTSQVGVVGQRETREGAVTTGTFQVHGTWAVVPKLTTVTLPGTSATGNVSRGPVELELSVAEGSLRVYLGEAGETRGPWFERGFVKGTDAFFQRTAMLYRDASPGHPARFRGRLEQIGRQGFFFYIEPLPGAPVKEMEYRLWGE